MGLLKFYEALKEELKSALGKSINNAFIVRLLSPLNCNTYGSKCLLSLSPKISNLLPLNIKSLTNMTKFNEDIGTWFVLKSEALRKFLA